MSKIQLRADMKDLLKVIESMDIQLKKEIYMKLRYKLLDMFHEFCADLPNNDYWFQYSLYYTCLKYLPEDLIFDEHLELIVQLEPKINNLIGWYFKD